ncbi:MAG: hypothetical protein NTX65_10695 [Ignavibacteriales bacterium]|nr:hypothetical protein [Ignavibacteriales bacterium]
MKLRSFLFLLLVLSIPLIAQEKHEVNSEVKELSEFHDVIYQIWHTAWPEKNVQLLKQLLPDVEKAYDKVKTAVLPGILRDKKSKWDEGLKKFGVSVDAYKDAAGRENAQAILDAAEKLHSDYEGLVRIVKPVLKEVDAFHQELYMMYHYYSANFELEKIKTSAATLKNKMVDVMAAKLTKRLEPKQEKFDKARNELNDAVLKLNEIVAKSNDKKEITNAVDGMHSKYEELEKVFD